MSDTRRWTKPGWNPSNPQWCFYPGMTEKFQERDHRGISSAKNHRFVKGLRNSQHNLEQKNDELRLEESLSSDE